MKELLQAELNQIAVEYAHELNVLKRRTQDALDRLNVPPDSYRERISSHDPFNIAATVQNLAVLAGRFAQTMHLLREE